MKIEVDPVTDVKRVKIVQSRGDFHPQIHILGSDGEVLHYSTLPDRAYVSVKDGDKVVSGTLLAKSPRTALGTADITGGLPRVTELFEARTPKDPAIMAEIEGLVELGDKRRGKRIIVVRNSDTEEEREHLVPLTKHLRVHTGDRVRAGDALVDGARPPHEILSVLGEEEVQRYLSDEIQSVYRAQGVVIDDKHIEIIVAQMMRKVQVTQPGDSTLLPNSLLDRHVFRKLHEELLSKDKNPPTRVPVLMGITKASVQSDSFISAASFQETTKVLTEAALRGKVDGLLGLKENVILGNLIPAGTGFRSLLRTRVQKNVDFSQFEDALSELPMPAEDGSGEGEAEKT
jgi:DNA-directed RNA polymerase subunit beta'